MSSKIEIVGFGAQGHVPNSRAHRTKDSEAFPISKSNSYKFRLKQNSSPEVLSIPFPSIYHKDGRKMAEQFPMFFPVNFYDFLMIFF